MTVLVATPHSPVEIDGVRQIVAWNHRALMRVEPADGRLLWEFPFPHKTHNQNMPTPAFHDGKILLGAENRGIHAIAPALNEGKWARFKNLDSKGVALDMASAIVADDFLLWPIPLWAGTPFCLDPKTEKSSGKVRPGQGLMPPFFPFLGTY